MSRSRRRPGRNYAGDFRLNLSQGGKSSRSRNDNDDYDYIEDELEGGEENESASILNSPMIGKLASTVMHEMAPGGLSGVIKGFESRSGKQIIGAIGSILEQNGRDFGLNDGFARVIGKSLLAVVGESSALNERRDAAVTSELEEEFDDEDKADGPVSDVY